MSTVDEIRAAFLNGTSRRRAYAAMCLAQSPKDVPAVIDDFVDMILRTELSSESAPKVVPRLLTFSAMALSNFLNDATEDSKDVAKAELALLQLAKSSSIPVAGGAIFWIRRLEKRGSFAWESLLARVNALPQAGEDAVVTLRAIAYRALLAIDGAGALTLGDIPAKAELIRSIELWLTKKCSPKDSLELRRELALLQ